MLDCLRVDVWHQELKLQGALTAQTARPALQSLLTTGAVATATNAVDTLVDLSGTPALGAGDALETIAQ
eukprot:1518801-Pyramimonas_sp.AAC.1